MRWNPKTLPHINMQQTFVGANIKQAQYIVITKIGLKGLYYVRDNDK